MNRILVNMGATIIISASLCGCLTGSPSDELVKGAVINSLYFGSDEAFEFTEYRVEDSKKSATVIGPIRVDYQVKTISVVMKSKKNCFFQDGNKREFTYVPLCVNEAMLNAAKAEMAKPERSLASLGSAMLIRDEAKLDRAHPIKPGDPITIKEVRVQCSKDNTSEPVEWRCKLAR